MHAGFITSNGRANINVDTMVYSTCCPGQLRYVHPKVWRVVPVSIIGLAMVIAGAIGVIMDRRELAELARRNRELYGTSQSAEEDSSNGETWPYAVLGWGIFGFLGSLLYAYSLQRSSMDQGRTRETMISTTVAVNAAVLPPLPHSRKTTVGQSATVRGERGHPTDQSATLPGERDQPTDQSATLPGERVHPTDQSATLRGERGHPTDQSATLPGERDQPTDQSATLPGERDQPTDQSATLPAGRSQPPGLIQPPVRGGDCTLCSDNLWAINDNTGDKEDCEPSNSTLSVLGSSVNRTTLLVHNTVSTSDGDKQNSIASGVALYAPRQSLLPTTYLAVVENPASSHSFEECSSQSLQKSLTISEASEQTSKGHGMMAYTTTNSDSTV